MTDFVPLYKKLLRDPVTFARSASGLTLRRYQRGVIEAIFDSVIHARGMEFVVMFPRQSGKNELQAQLEVYLLALLSLHPVEMIKVSLTLHPQALNCMRRLEKVLRGNLLLEQAWRHEAGDSYRLGNARLTFLSGAPESSIVGATANALLEVDEAQDVTILKFDRDISPMTASTCATRVFWGTAWTSATLLSRQLRAAVAAEKSDGVRRVFRLTADEVSAEVALPVRLSWSSRWCEMAGVIKSAGRFVLQPDPALTARAQHASDTALLKKELTPPELRGVLERILQRLEALES